MTPREQRHYDAIQSMHLTIAAMRRFHEYYISRKLNVEIDALQMALTQELNHIREEADKAERVRPEGA